MAGERATDRRHRRDRDLRLVRGERRGGGEVRRVERGRRRPAQGGVGQLRRSGLGVLPGPRQFDDRRPGAGPRLVLLGVRRLVREVRRPPALRVADARPVVGGGERLHRRVGRRWPGGGPQRLERRVRVAGGGEVHPPPLTHRDRRPDSVGQLGRRERRLVGGEQLPALVVDGDRRHRAVGEGAARRPETHAAAAPDQCGDQPSAAGHVRNPSG
jgi:hypothetical protein